MHIVEHTLKQILLHGGMLDHLVIIPKEELNDPLTGYQLTDIIERDGNRHIRLRRTPTIGERITDAARAYSLNPNQENLEALVAVHKELNQNPGAIGGPTAR